MSIQEVRQLNQGDIVGFAGILSSETRQGRFIRIVNDFLVEIAYADHNEQNHIANIYKV